MIFTDKNYITWDSASGRAFMDGKPIDFSYVNPYLEVSEQAILTMPIVDSIIQVRGYFQSKGMFASVTSGYRSPEHQVRVIVGYLVSKGLLKDCPEIKQGIEEKWKIDKIITTQYFENIYWWQIGWSRLLEIGIVINPAYQCVCLRHSLRPDGSDRKGKLISQTPHVKGYSYDIGGGYDHDPTNEFLVMQEAQKDATCKIKDLTLEHGNSCVHTDVIIDV